MIQFFFIKILDWEILSQLWENIEKIQIRTGAEYRPQIDINKTMEWKRSGRGENLPGYLQISSMSSITENWDTQWSFY